MQLILAIVCVGVAVMFSGCASPSARPVHWGYDDEKGPDKWGVLSPAYASCKNGTMQSPIDIPPVIPTNAMGVVVDYGNTSLDISHHEHVDDLIDNGHTIQVDVDGDHKITISGVDYTLRQFHFHTPSEHRFAGDTFPMEMHLVHQSADGRFAVIGVLFMEDEGVATIYDRMIQHMPQNKGERIVVDSVSLDINLLLPPIRNVYHYVGSFTTPPCTENVQWLILGEPMKVSSAVIAAITQRLAPNNRPVQPSNGRKITIE